MTFIHLPYTSLSDLLSKFSDLKISRHAVVPEQTNPAPNFVLIHPELYYGSYGGIVASQLLAGRRGRFVSEALDDSLSIVWWSAAVPDIAGDTFALSVEDRKAVTPSMFRRMVANTLVRDKPARSSYYTCDRAWSMNFESSAYSDSE